MTEAPHPLWVDAPEQVADLCRRARRAGRVAVDTEADSFHSYFHKLCLVQLSFDDVHALLDPLALGSEGLAPMSELLAANDTTVLMHGADYDVRVLDRDLGARIRGLRDTQLAAQLLGEPQTGLAALLAKELGVEVDKKYQRADWGRRPLGPELRAYAAGDTAHLEELPARLEARLDELGRVAWWLEECRALEQVRYEAPEPNPLAFERVKGARKLKGAARDRMAALFAWRDAAAAAEDRPPFHILSNEGMLTLATEPPERADELGRVRGVPRSLARRRAAEIMAALEHPAPAPERQHRPRTPVDRTRENRVKELRSVRDRVAAELGIDPGVLAPRAALERVVDGEPSDRAGVEKALERRWRAEVLAGPLLETVAGWASEPGDAATA